jgi:hypothetical protein
MCPLQGLDVVHAVSRAAVGVANSLDSAIEQLMEGWVSPLDRGGRRRASQGLAASASPSSSAIERGGATSIGRAIDTTLVRQDPVKEGGVAAMPYLPPSV